MSENNITPSFDYLAGDKNKSVSEVYFLDFGMGWYDRIIIKLHLMKIFVKLFVSFWNPFNGLFLHPIVFFLYKKAQRAAQDPNESTSVKDICDEVSPMIHKKYTKIDHKITDFSGHLKPTLSHAQMIVSKQLFIKATRDSMS